MAAKWFNSLDTNSNQSSNGEKIYCTFIIEVLNQKIHVSRSANSYFFVMNLINIMLYKTSKFKSTNNHPLKWFVIVAYKFDQIHQLRTSQMSKYNYWKSYLYKNSRRWVITLWSCSIPMSLRISIITRASFGKALKVS